MPFRPIIILLFLGGVTAATASELDWDEVDWSRGSTQQTFSNVDGTNIDITITLTLSYDWNYYYQSRWSTSGTASPDDTSTFGGDWGTQDGQSLYLKPDFASNDRTKSYLDVKISFSESVKDVSFNLFDVDVGLYYTSAPGIEFEDIIEKVAASNQGQDAGTATVNTGSKIIVDEATDPGNTLYRGNTRIDDGGYDQNDNPESVLNIGWNAPVDEVSFRYSSGSRAEWNPGDQAIGLSNIGFHEYNAVPEPGTYLSGGLLLMSVAWIAVRRRKIRQEQPS